MPVPATATPPLPQLAALRKAGYSAVMAVTDKGLEVQALLATEDLAPHMTKKVAADMGIVLEDANRGREWDTKHLWPPCCCWAGVPTDQ